ncbi:MAG TPA: divergent polysaccharide deacetylase family protein [Acetobacteraceae bacterium]|nr:divergent polysaccharide deacetylase family protein [Acetobacteraceae bacterium]
MSGRSSELGRAGRCGGWRALGWFWCGIAGASVLGAGLLQWMGPPPVSLPAVAPEAPALRRTAAIAPPDPALLEPDPAEPGRMLPRIADDGRAPRAVYAAHGPPAAPGIARIGLIVAGIGLNAAESQAAVRDLPDGATLALSPYGALSPALLEAIRRSGHEFLVSLPMEPDGGGLDDAGDHALLISLPTEENLSRLNWVLSRAEGYVGLTDLLAGDLRGRRFTSDPEAVTPILDVLARRGLAYAGAQPETPGHGGLWARKIDLLIYADDGPAAVDAALDQLLALARRQGTALGAVGVIRSTTLAQIMAWAKTLSARQAALTPVSALVAAPDAAPR